MSAQIEELLNMASSVDSKKLSSVVGGLESQLESIKRSGDPRPSSVGSSVHQIQPESGHGVMMQSAQSVHQQSVATVQYVTHGSHQQGFQSSNVIIAQPQSRVVASGPRHPNAQSIAYIQNGQMIPSGQMVQSHAVGVNSNQIQRMQIANGSRPMLVSFPQNLQNLPQNTVFQIGNGQQILFLPRGPNQAVATTSQQAVSVPRNIVQAAAIKQQPIASQTQQQQSIAAQQQQQQPQPIMGNEDLAGRGRKFLADLVAIATKQDPSAGNKISRLIDEVKSGHKNASLFVTEVQAMFPIVVRTGDESQSQIDQSTLVMMVQAAIAPGGLTGRSTPQQSRPPPQLVMGQSQQQMHQQHQLAQHPQMQQPMSQIRIAQGGIQSSVLVAGNVRPTLPVQQQNAIPQQQAQSVHNPGQQMQQPPSIVTRPPIMRGNTQTMPSQIPPQQSSLTINQMQQMQQQQQQSQLQSQRPGSQLSRQRLVKMEAAPDSEIADVAISGVELPDENRALLSNQSFNLQSHQQPSVNAPSTLPQRPGATTQSPPRMSREQPMLATVGPTATRPPSGSVVTRLQHIVASNGLALPPATAQSGQNESATALVNLLALATQNYLKDFVEQMAIVCAHRLYNLKTDSTRYEQIGDLRVQLRAIEKIEQKMMDQYAAGGLRSLTANASDADKATDDTNAAVSAAIGISRISSMDAGKSSDDSRQRDANATALAAIGGRRWMNKTGNNMTGPVSANTPPPTGASEELEARQQQQRARKANLADVLFVLHQHPRLSRHPNLIYKYTNSSK